MLLHFFIVIFGGFSQEVTKIQTEKKINSSEFLLSWGITAPKNLNLHKFSVPKSSSFCDRRGLNFQACVTQHLAGWLLARLFVYLPSFISQIPDFLYWLVCILFLMAWQWKHRIKITISLFAKRILPCNKLKLVALHMLRVVSIAWKEIVIKMALHIQGCH